MIGPMLKRADLVTGLDPCLKAVLTRLCMDADHHGGDSSTLSVRALGTLTGFSERSVRRAISLLQAKGQILRVGEHGMNVWQTIVDPRPLPISASKTRGGRPNCKLPTAKRRRIMERDAYRCRHCGDHRNLSIDHIIPRAAGGSNDDSNLQTLCIPCNMEKGAALP